MTKNRSTIRELYEYRDLLRNLTVTELKLRYRDSLLGFLWTVLNPLFFLLILALVFSRLIRFEVPHYPLFLFAGLTSWLMIQQTVLIATASIVNNQGLIRKVAVPKLVFPLSNVLARYVDHAVLAVLLVAFIPVFGAAMGWGLFFLPVSIALHILFSLGLSLLCAVAYIKVRDVQNIAAVVFQALFYATPILYPLEALPEKLRPILMWNPFYYFVEMVRAPVYGGAFPKGFDFGVAVGLAVGVCGLGLWVFRRKEREFVFYLS
jgi:ABC-type polysaccharide/polyol phosphate export permease